jgi:creatinine amidohydrolase
MLNTFNTSPEVAQSNVDTAVLPLGSLEPKGPHLPIGLDMMLAERFAYDLCKGKAVYLLPTFPYSTAMEARGFAGTVALQQQSIWNVIEDIARFLAKNRFKRLVILDLSNYNWIVKHCVREINLDTEIIQTVWASPKVFAAESAAKDLLPDFGGGAVETSLALHLFPSLVKKPVADYEPGVPREYIDYEGLAKVSPQGYWGKPSKATKALGKAFYATMLEKTAEFVDYAFKMWPGGTGLGEHKGEELWWPEGEIPGARAGGFDWHMSTAEIAGSGTDMAILPTTSTEQHSPSQPLATDYVQGLELSREMAAQLGAYLLPAMPFVTSWCHRGFRGTMTLRAMSVRQVLEDAAASLHASGFKKIVIVNFHGGNWVVKPTMIELNRAYPDMRVVSTGDILAYRGQAASADLHANAGEGSFIKAFYPKAFKAEAVVDFSPNCTASALDFVGMAGVSPYGTWGWPSKSTAEAGRKYLADHVKDSVAYVKKTLGDLEKRYGSRG